MSRSLSATQETCIGPGRVGGDDAWRGWAILWIWMNGRIAKEDGVRHGMYSAPLRIPCTTEGPEKGGSAVSLCARGGISHGSCAVVVKSCWPVAGGGQGGEAESPDSDQMKWGRSVDALIGGPGDPSTGGWESKVSTFGEPDARSREAERSNGVSSHDVWALHPKEENTPNDESGFDDVASKIWKGSELNNVWSWRGREGYQDMDHDYDWSEYVGQYNHPFSIWNRLQAENLIDQRVTVDSSPKGLNTEQRKIYNTVVNQYT